MVDDPHTVVVDFKDALIIDGGITYRFAKVEKHALLINLPHKSHGRLHRIGNHGTLEKQIIQDKDELISVEEGEEKVGAAETAEAADRSVHAGYSGDAGAAQTKSKPNVLQDSPMLQAEGTLLVVNIPVIYLQPMRTRYIEELANSF